MSMKNTIKSGVRSGGKKPAAPSGGSKSPSPSRPARTISSPVPSSAPAPKPKTPVQGPQKPVQKPQTPAYTPAQPRPSVPMYTQVPMPSQAANAAYNEAAQRLASARSYWERLAGLATLPTLFGALEQVNSSVAALDGMVAEARTRGYRFGRSLEEQAQSVRLRWPQQRNEAARLIEQQRGVLQTARVDVENLLRRAASDVSLIGTAESRISAFERNVRDAEAQGRGLFDQTYREVNALRAQLQEVDQMLDALDTASFDLLPDEHGIAACPAAWISDRDQPEGVLFLTDARLVFEQRQEIATKKILFFTTKTELIQKKLWESPIGAVDESQAEDQTAFLSRKEILTLSFALRTRELPSDVTLELRGADNEA